MAQTEVPLPLPAQPETDEPYGTRSEAAALIRHLVDANVRTMQAMASAFGQVSPAQAVSVPVMVAAEEGPSQAGPNWTQILPHIPNLIQQLIGAMQQVTGGVSPLGGGAGPQEGGK